MYLKGTSLRPVCMSCKEAVLVVKTFLNLCLKDQKSSGKNAQYIRKYKKVCG